MFVSLGDRRARRGALAAIALSVALLGAACVPPPSGGGGGGGVAGDIVNRHNSARANSGLPGLAVDGGMNANAQMHANRLAGGGGGCGNLWHSGELGAWYRGSAGENLGCVGPCPSNGAQLMSSWLNSPAHRANILNGGYRFIGVGVVCSGGVQYAVVHYRS